MKRLLGIMVIGFGLAGCVAGPRTIVAESGGPQREQELAAARQACAQRYGAHWVARARCVNEAEDRTIRAAFAYPDLYARRQALRLQLAGKQERHELTEDEARQQFTAADAQIQREMARRAQMAAVRP